MYAFLSSLLFLLYFSLLDYRNGEIIAWKMYCAWMLQSVVYFLTGSPNLLLIAGVVLYGLLFQKLGLWFSADTVVLGLVFMQYSVNLFVLGLSICFCLPVYLLFYRLKFQGENPRLVPGFFLALSVAAMVQLVSGFPTTI